MLLAIKVNTVELRSYGIKVNTVEALWLSSLKRNSISAMKVSKIGIANTLL